MTDQKDQLTVFMMACCYVQNKLQCSGLVDALLHIASVNASVRCMTFMDQQQPFSVVQCNARNLLVKLMLKVF